MLNKQKPNNMYIRFIISVLVLIAIIILNNFLKTNQYFEYEITNTIYHILTIAISSWVLIEIVKIFKRRLLRKYDISDEDNLKSRKLHTP